MRYLMMVLILMAVGCTKGAEMVQQPTLLAQATIDPYVIPVELPPGAAGGEVFAEWIRTAMAAGVDIWQGARVVGLRQTGEGFAVQVERDAVKQEIEARFVIGADGSASGVRDFLFPELEVEYRQIYQECYRGKLELERDYMHWFYPAGYWVPN